jgi:hypothetical protein
MQPIQLHRKREFLTLLVFLGFVIIGALLFLDIDSFIHPQRYSPGGWRGAALLFFINVFLLCLLFCNACLILPDLLAVYTEDGLRWPGGKTIRWSEVTAVIDRRSDWRGREIVIESPRHTITLHPWLFRSEGELLDEIKRRVPAHLWSQVPR